MRTFLAIWFLFSVQVKAAELYPATASQADVQAAIDAAFDGDRVNIPAGTPTYTLGLSNGGKAVSLRGAGKTATIITENWTTAESYEHFINWTGTHTSLVVLSDFTIHRTATQPASMISLGTVSTTNIICVARVGLTNLNGKVGISPNGWSLGVAYDCDIYSTAGASGFAPTGDGVSSDGSYGWNTRPPTWGDTNKFYIENCRFIWDTDSNANGAVDAYTGTRFAFRFNTVQNINVGNHGTDSSGANRSTHSWEVYGNTFSNTTSATMLLFAFRGGTGLIFSNTLTKAGSGNIHGGIGLINYRTTGTNVYGGTTACCDPWGPIDGSNPNDGNVLANGWPALDSIGKSSPTTFVTGTTATNGIATGYSVQAVIPHYQWENRLNGVLMTSSIGNNYTNTGIYSSIPSAVDIIQEGRDYFDNEAKAGYAPLEYPHPLVAVIDGDGFGGVQATGKPRLRGKGRIK